MKGNGENVKMNIGANIRKLRKEKRMSQEELAEHLHISSQAVSKWETGVSSPDIDMLPKLAILFGTSLDNLLDFDQSRVDAAIEDLLNESEIGKGDLVKTERSLRKALEKYTTSDLLMTCLLENLQEQNKDGGRNAEIIEIGERVLDFSDDVDLRIDVYRILAETYHSMGEQTMAESYLARIPGLNFLYYEIAAAIRTGEARIKEIGTAEYLCIEKLICMLWMRREEAVESERAAVDGQAREMLEFFKRYPAYKDIAELMEKWWNEGTIMEIYR